MMDIRWVWKGFTERSSATWVCLECRPSRLQVPMLLAMRLLSTRRWTFINSTTFFCSIAWEGMSSFLCMRSLGCQRFHAPSLISSAGAGECLSHEAASYVHLMPFLRKPRYPTGCFPEAPQFCFILARHPRLIWIALLRDFFFPCCFQFSLNSIFQWGWWDLIRTVLRWNPFLTVYPAQKSSRWPSWEARWHSNKNKKR